MPLPLAKKPFTAPTDRDMLPSERRAFVHTHRTCVFGYRRRHDGPAMSVVYYIPTDDDELLVSTMAARGKARAVARDGKVSLCSTSGSESSGIIWRIADSRTSSRPSLIPAMDGDTSTSTRIPTRWVGEPFG